MIGLPEIVFAVLTACMVFGVLLVIRSGSDRRRQAESARLRDDSDDSGVIQLSKDPITLTPKPVPTGAGARVDRWFDRAVVHSGLDASPAGVVALSSLLGLVFAAGLYFWKQQLGLTLLGVALGVAIPVIVVAILQGRYKKKIQDQLPDALYLLAGSLRSGLTLEQALEFFSQRGNKPLADEFKHTVGLMRLGSPVTAALKATADRIGLLDFDLLVSTVGLYTQTGGNLAMLFDRLAASVRDRNQFRGQFRASTAQARVVALAIGAAVPLFLIAYALFEPQHVAVFFASTAGWTILIGCVIMEIIGVLWLWQVFKIEY
jgi:tight adherence protein B